MTTRRILIRTETAATFFKTIDVGNGVWEGGVDLTLDSVVDGKKVSEYPLGITALSSAEGSLLVPTGTTDAKPESQLTQRIGDCGDDEVEFFTKLPEIRDDEA